MVYVTSDLHGYPLEKFLAFLKKSGFTEKDFLVIIGDVIDRGSDGARILEWIIEQDNVELLLGNHELMMLKCEFAFMEINEGTVQSITSEKMRSLKNWAKNGAEPTLTGLSKLPREKLLRIVEYLKGCSYYEDVKIGNRRFVLVHGGIPDYRKGKPLNRYDPYDLVWHRPSLDEVYDGDFTVILGHTPTWHYGDRYKGRMIKTKSWINIDTGVAFGLDPMLLRLDDMQAFYIK